MDDPAKKRFVWALVLAWAPWVPTLIGLANAFRGISASKATGIAAVAGSMAELFVAWGIITMITSQVVATVWLLRSLSRDHLLRNLISVVSIAFSALMLLVIGFFLWMVWFMHGHA